MTTPPQGVAQEYAEIVGANPNAVWQPNYHDRIAIWEEHCERSHRAEAKAWCRVLVVLGIAAAFFAGFATCAVELVH